MIQLYKGEETAQCTLEQKTYLPLSPKIWAIVLWEIKNAKSLDIFFLKKQSSGQQINVLADFAKDSLAMYVGFI